MKASKPDGERELKPSKNNSERPDNGSRGWKEQGSNAGLFKHNPHKPQTLACHAWLIS